MIKQGTYIGAINNIEELADLSSPGNSVLIVGGFGRLDPVPFLGKFTAAGFSIIYLEVAGRDRNRDLVSSALFSAAASGFNGAVLASGLFSKGTNMAKPVYDLDPAQMLKLALDLKREKLIQKNFSIGVRAAYESEASKARAQYFLNNGADFLILTCDSIPDELSGRALLAQSRGVAK